MFDPRYDTFGSVRERSSMLFDVICAVGCRAECGEYPPPSHPILSDGKRNTLLTKTRTRIGCIPISV